MSRMGWLVLGQVALSWGCAVDDVGPVASSEDSEGSADSDGPGSDSAATESSGVTPMPTSEDGSSSEGSESGGSGTSDGSDTGPDLDPGECYDGDHDGYYPCECDEGETQSCKDGGIQVCIVDDYEVYTATRWSDCLECEPGTGQECTADGDVPGMMYCNVASVAELDERFGAQWGACIDTTMLACDPIAQTGCARGTMCRVDGDGVPSCVE